MHSDFNFVCREKKERANGLRDWSNCRARIASYRIGSVCFQCYYLIVSLSKEIVSGPHKFVLTFNK